ncbi:MAG: EAL domain-containing protein [Pseudomonadota bacterium]
MQIQLGIISRRYEQFIGKLGDFSSTENTRLKLLPLTPDSASGSCTTADIVLIDFDSVHNECEEYLAGAILPAIIATDSPAQFDAQHWLSQGVIDYLFNIHTLGSEQLVDVLQRCIIKYNSAAGSQQLSDAASNITHNRIMQGSPVMAAVWVMDDPNNIRFLHVTQNIDQLGINGDDLIAGRHNWVQLMEPEDRPPAYSQLCHAIDSGADNYLISYRVITEKSGVRWVQDYGRITRYDNGKVRYFESLIIDITENKANDQRYRELFLQAEQQTKELRLLNEVQSAIANKASLNSLFEQTVETVSSILGYELVMITMLRNERIWRGPTRGYIGNEVPTSIGIDQGLVGKAVKSGKPLLVKDVSIEPDYYQILPDVVSNICVPFFHSKDEVYGALIVEKNNTLNAQDLSLLTKVAEQISMAVENVRLHEKTRADLNRTRAFYEISQSIREADNTADMLDEIIRSTRLAVSARWAIIYKFDYERQVVELVSKTAYDSSPLMALDFEQLNSGLTGWAIEHREVVLALDVKADPRENKYVREYKDDGDQIGSAIVAPLLVRGRPIGTLAVVNSDHDEVFTEEDRDLISTDATQSALALTQHQLQVQIQHQAYHDSLTGLPNRSVLDIRLQQSMQASLENQAMTAVMFIDLDGFKHINDTLGHHVGDTILIDVSRRLKTVVTGNNTLVRLGGDEFAVIIGNLNSRAAAMAIGDDILQVLEPSFTVDHHRLHIGASIGISMYPDDTSEAGSLLRYADSAMYHAKAEGKNNVRCFVPALAQQANERLELENYLRHALDMNELFLEYQPQFCLQSQQLIGFEALLRWNHPQRGRLSPDLFIPIAEESGLIVPIGRWVLEEVCRQSMQWQAQGYPPMRVAVNISAVQFARDDFIDQVEAVLNHSDMPTQLLEFEVTESVVMRDVKLVIQRLRKLRKMGLRIAIDDFGTGYSSLRYLQQLPLDALKIDRSFIAAASDRQQDRALIETIIELAQRFGLNTVAEGVENQAQLDYLKHAGCTDAQGYHFAKPLPADDVERLYFHVDDQGRSAA